MPSLTFPQEELRKIAGIQFYEERMLFLLLRLADPGARLIYLTSVRVEEPIVDYYLRFLPDTRGAQERLYMISLWDASSRALTEKILERDEVLDRIRDLAQGATMMVTFTCTEPEARLSELTGIPLHGPRPALAHLGSKSGGRVVAGEAGVAVLPGGGDLRSERDVYAVCARLKASGSEAAVVKLNHGFSGQGNAILDLSDLSENLHETPTIFCAPDESWAIYEQKIRRDGAVVEHLLREPGVVSPSVQLRIHDDGRAEILSTHDQILGGPDDQVYLGCRFPADGSYRHAIIQRAVAVGTVMAGKGVRGMFGIDFIVRPRPDPDVYLAEINLRLGGTTHPFLMTRAVTRGRYDFDSGELITDDGPRAYVATDNFKSDDLVGLDPAELIRAVDDEGLAFDPAARSGVLLHLLGALKKHGKFGATCVAPTMTGANQLYALLERLLARLATERQGGG